MNMISIIVSVFNEEAVLEMFYQAFGEMKDKLTWDYELIFVDDGSKDNSYEILKEISQRDTRVKVIHFSRNFGHEAAMIAGIDFASGDGVLCMDADLQHPLEYIPQIIEKLEQGYEVINMVRTENRSVGLFKNLASRCFYKLINRMSDQADFQENASDYFAMSRRVADILRTNYREKNRFLRGYVQIVGFRKTTINYKAGDRAGGKTHYKMRKLLSFSVDTIMSFSDMPLKLGVYSGLGCSLLGLAVLIYTLCTFRDAPSGYATIVILICFLFAILFVVVGIIGEYISVLFAELKDRPIYIIEDTINMEGRQGKHEKTNKISIN